MNLPLKGKKAVITGGSRGIGRAIAELLLHQGAQVWLLARDVGELENARDELSKLGNIEISSVDVSDNIAVEKAVKEIAAQWKRVDVLVNAAGVYGPIGIVTEVDPDEWHSALEINLYGTFLMTRLIGSMMQTERRGVIVNFVGGGEGAYSHFSSYVAAKGGVARFTETVAEELKEFGIRVNAIAPGAVNTKFLSDLLKAGPEKAGEANYERALKQEESGGVAPEKAAGLVAWLSSDASDGITGRILSAVWDPYEELPKHKGEIMKSDVYTFRRIRPSDRGFGWGEKE